jgi:hypothetical protein
MGKSLRNKKKVAARTQKRTDSFYAVHHAARLQRLSAKLTTEGEIVKPDHEAKEEDDEIKVDGESIKDDTKETKAAVKQEEDGMWSCVDAPLTFPNTFSLSRHGHSQENLDIRPASEPKRRVAHVQGSPDPTGQQGS